MCRSMLPDQKGVFEAPTASVADYIGTFSPWRCLYFTNYSYVKCLFSSAFTDISLSDDQVHRWPNSSFTPSFSAWGLFSACWGDQFFYLWSFASLCDCEPYMACTECVHWLLCVHVWVFTCCLSWRRTWGSKWHVTWNGHISCCHYSGARRRASQPEKR